MRTSYLPDEWQIWPNRLVRWPRSLHRLRKVCLSRMGGRGLDVMVLVRMRHSPWWIPKNLESKNYRWGYSWWSAFTVQFYHGELEGAKNWQRILTTEACSRLHSSRPCTSMFDRTVVHSVRFVIAVIAPFYDTLIGPNLLPLAYLKWISWSDGHGSKHRRRKSSPPTHNNIRQLFNTNDSCGSKNHMRPNPVTQLYWKNSLNLVTQVWLDRNLIDALLQVFRPLDNLSVRYCWLSFNAIWQFIL